MPNTDPPLTSREAILRSIDDADRALAALRIPLVHGLYAGLTADPGQITEAVAGVARSVSPGGGPEDVRRALHGEHGHRGEVGTGRACTGASPQLGFTGVLAVHCEKEALLRPDAWDPSRPSSHGRARPPAAEVASVDDQKELAAAAGFAGTLHVCHISTPWALDVLRGTHAPKGPAAAEARPGVKVSCGLTPHHALLDQEMMDGPDGMSAEDESAARPRPLPGEDDRPAARG